MANEYRDAAGNTMSREQVQRLAPEALAERSGKNLVIYGSHELLYDALAEVMMEVIGAAGGQTNHDDPARGADAPLPGVRPEGGRDKYRTFALADLQHGRVSGPDR